MPGFTGCQSGNAWPNLSLLISRCTVTSKKFKCCWYSVLFIAHTLTKAKYKAVKKYTSGPVGLKMGCYSFYSEVPVSTGVNVIFKV